jgi:kynurenine formamidase
MTIRAVSSRLLALAALSLVAGCCVAPPIDESKVVDLTHSFNSSTVYWPTATQFELKQVAHGHDAHGRWYAANDFSASEHGGTHIDAPIHFAPGGATTERIPLTQLIAPARVIDVRLECAADRNYLLSPEDIRRHELLHGRIPAGAAVLVLTGHGAFYPRVIDYLGSDRRGSAEGLHFPGISAAAAQVLVERKVDLVGLDTASLDHGPSRDFAAHRVFAAADIPGLENLANLERLPPAGATIIALPMKIERGTGGPCRVMALLP